MCCRHDAVCCSIFEIAYVHAQKMREKKEKQDITQDAKKYWGFSARSNDVELGHRG